MNSCWAFAGSTYRVAVRDTYAPSPKHRAPVLRQVLATEHSGKMSPNAPNGPPLNERSPWRHTF